MFTALTFHKTEQTPRSRIFTTLCLARPPPLSPPSPYLCASRLFPSFSFPSLSLSEQTLFLLSHHSFDVFVDYIYSRKNLRPCSAAIYLWTTSTLSLARVTKRPPSMRSYTESPSFDHGRSEVPSSEGRQSRKQYRYCSCYCYSLSCRRYARSHGRVERINYV